MKSPVTSPARTARERASLDVPVVYTTHPSLGEALSDIAEASQELVVDRLELLKLDVQEQVEAAAKKAVRGAAAAALLFVGYLLLTAAAIVGLSFVIGPGWALAAVGAPHLALGVYLLFAPTRSERRGDA